MGSITLARGWLIGLQARPWWLATLIRLNFKIRETLAFRFRLEATTLLMSVIFALENISGKWMSSTQNMVALRLNITVFMKIAYTGWAWKILISFRIFSRRQEILIRIVYSSSNTLVQERTIFTILRWMPWNTKIWLQWEKMGILFTFRVSQSKSIFILTI
jgi:hypothetical protein